MFSNYRFKANVCHLSRDRINLMCFEIGKNHIIKILNYQKYLYR